MRLGLARAGFPAWTPPAAASRWPSIASVAFHAVLLSIHFKLPDKVSRLTQETLEVVLVNAKSARKPDKAQARAQANLDGGGNTDENRRAKTPLPAARSRCSPATA
jgi:protein TonB